MLAFIHFATILISLLLSNVVARNGCRQCFGEYSITFTYPVGRDVADNVVSPGVAGCATGDNWETTAARSAGICLTTTGPTACTTWIYAINVWRYCGNGGSVSLSKPRVCSPAGYCGVSKLTMSCRKSVECIGKCEPKQC